MLLLHGVRSDRTQMLGRARFLNREGYAALLIDLPAHGQSTGDRITFGAREAAGAKAALEFLRRESPGERIAVIGVSLGAAAAVLAGPLLWQLPLRAGVSTSDLRPIERIARLGAPALIASGAQDLHTTWAETEQLFDAAAGPKELWRVEGAGHVDLHAYGPGAYERRVLGFLAKYLRSEG